MRPAVLPARFAAPRGAGWHFGQNTLAQVLPHALPGTMLFKWDHPSGSYLAYQYDELARGWFPPDGTLAPGEGAWIFSPERKER